MSFTCPECGLPLHADDVFCGNCGRPAGTRDRDGSGRPSTEPTVPPPWPGQRSGPPPRRPPEGPPPSGSSFPQDQRGQEQQPEVGPSRSDGRPLTDGAARIRSDARGAAAEGNDSASPAPFREITRIDANADQRLSYTETSNEPTFDPLRNSRFGWQLARRFALFFVAGALANILITLFFLFVALVTGDRSALNILPVLSFLIEAGLFVAYALMPVPALLTQWSRLLSFRADVADIAFEHIAAAMDSHDTPSDSFQPRTLVPPGEGTRKYLELRRGVFTGFISCFAHGRDLYVGWSFWIYMSPLRWVLMRIGRYIQDRTGRGNDMYQTLRYDSTRATVAAMHACTLEGIDAAIRTIDPEGGLLGSVATFPAS
jgi:hypothetical protein